MITLSYDCIITREMATDTSQSSNELHCKIQRTNYNVLLNPAVYYSSLWGKFPGEILMERWQVSQPLTERNYPMLAIFSASMTLLWNNSFMGYFTSENQLMFSFTGLVYSVTFFYMLVVNRLSIQEIYINLLFPTFVIKVGLFSG